MMLAKSIAPMLTKARSDMMAFQDRVHRDEKYLSGEKNDLEEMKKGMKDLEDALKKETAKAKLAVAKSQFEQLKEIERNEKDALKEQQEKIDAIKSQVKEIEDQKKIVDL